MSINASLTGIQAIEFIHLTFLSVLQVRIDTNLYVLKGGVSLRYFYGSPRYSQDIDFDVAGIDRVKLIERVDGVLGSPAFAALLRSKGMSITNVSKPKQTDTTQRWKVEGSRDAGGEEVRTKMEFSRRSFDPRRRLDQIPPRIVRHYALRPPAVQRYLPEAMIEQKISALAERSETQARDVFDLDHLFRVHPDALQSVSVRPDKLAAAMERAADLSFEAYRAQVAAFLDPDVLELYDRPEAWSQMIEATFDHLARLR